MSYEESTDPNAEPGLVALDQAVEAFDVQLTDTRIAVRGQSLGVEMRTDSPNFDPYRYWAFQALVAEAEYKAALERGEDPDKAALTLLIKTTARTLVEEQWLAGRRAANKPLVTDEDRAKLRRVRSYHQLIRDVAHCGLDVPVRDLLLALDKPASMLAAMSDTPIVDRRVPAGLVRRIRHEDALREMLEAQGFEVGRYAPVYDFIEGTLKARDNTGEWVTVVLDNSVHPVEEADVTPRLYKLDPMGRRMVYFRTGLDDAAFANRFRLPDTKFQEQAPLVGAQFREVCDRFRGRGNNPVIWRSGS